MSPRLRAGVAGLATLLLSLLALVIPTAEAQAASYRFWGFYDWTDSAWAFSTENSTTAVPADGSVQGWRFALSGESSARVPRAEGDFDAICGAVAAEDGKKRVAFVIDYGTAEDGGEGSEPPAARGACAVMATDATSAQALTEVATTRIEAGLVCAVDSYPATGCGDATDDPPPTGSEAPVSLEGLAGASPGATSADATEADDDDGVSPGVLAGIGVALAAAVVLGVGATIQSRRSRQP
jgi:hypothetical protein